MTAKSALVAGLIMRIASISRREAVKDNQISLVHKAAGSKWRWRSGE
jgi:hypothetical protein